MKTQRIQIKLMLRVYFKTTLVYQEHVRQIKKTDKADVNWRRNTEGLHQMSNT